MLADYLGNLDVSSACPTPTETCLRISNFFWDKYGILPKAIIFRVEQLGDQIIMCYQISKLVFNMAFICYVKADL